MSGKYPEGFYVYLHRRKSDGLIFYVGKGSGGRAWLKSGKSRSEWWHRVASKHGVSVEIVWTGQSECCCFTIERINILKYRSLGNPLVNITDGGGGLSGFVPPRSMKTYSSLGEEFTSPNAAANFLKKNGYPKASHSAIQKVCKGRKHTAYGRAWSYDGFPPHPERVGNENRGEWQKKHSGRPVVNSGGYYFLGMNAAARWLRENGHPKASRANISQCCNGKTKQAYGYNWKYLDE